MKLLCALIGAFITPFVVKFTYDKLLAKPDYVLQLTFQGYVIFAGLGALLGIAIGHTLEKKYR